MRAQLRRRELLQASAALGVASALPFGLSGCAGEPPAFALGTVVDAGVSPVVFDARGFAWLLSPLENRLEVRDPDGAVVRTVTELARPRALAIDATGRGWLVESGAARLTSIDLDRGTVTVHGEDVLLAPRDVAVDADGHVLVADAHAHVIARFDGSGAWLGAIGLPVTAAIEDEAALNGPRSIAVAIDGTLLVGEGGARRVSRLASDGRWLETVVADLSAPRVVRVSSADGRFAVADPVRGEVRVLDAAGSLLATHRPARLPESLAFAPDGALWISGRDSA